MFHLQRFILTSLSIFMIAALTACTLGQAVEPTPTTVDVNAINTAAVATVQAQMTLNAALTPVATATPVLSETEGLPPSETPNNAPATNTPDSGVSVETPAVIFTPTPTEPGQADPVQTEAPVGAATTTPTMTAIPSFTPIGGGGSGGGEFACKNSKFIADMSIPDGTVFAPGTKFTKTWKIQNVGTCTWDEGFYFAAWSGPPSMGANKGPKYITTSHNFIDPQETVDMSIEMVAPDAPGDYVAHWQMYDDVGQPFGGDFTVVIKVVK